VADRLSSFLTMATSTLDRDRNPDLGSDGIRTCAEEGLDPQMLLDPFGRTVPPATAVRPDQSRKTRLRPPANPRPLVSGICHSRFTPQHIPFPLNPFPLFADPSHRRRRLRWVSMATERQIKANRANAAKSTGPKTAEGKRISSKNAALILHFQPRNSAETFLVQTMTVARRRLVRMRRIQTPALSWRWPARHENLG
jgi:hypothetical protein